MLSNIEQAVIDLLDQEKPITIPNVFSTYMRIAELDINSTNYAIATFERAMDKHAVRPDVVQSPMIVELRNQYWYSKLGGCKEGKGVHHTCEKCGGIKSYEGSGNKAVLVEPGADQRRQVKVRVKTKKFKRICRNLDIPNPYGPSTSTAK